MLNAGVCVALGTDSLASNPNLSLLDEMKFVHQTYPDIPLETIIRMGTLNGALALGIAGRFGSLEPGKTAKFGFW
jgi:cytosine/adenosine deaminase-related metal-dependent hydrolase